MASEAWKKSRTAARHLRLAATHYQNVLGEEKWDETDGKSEDLVRAEEDLYAAAIEYTKTVEATGE